MGNPTNPLKDIRHIADHRHYGQALRYCSEFLAGSPNNLEALWQRAYLWAQIRSPELAMADLSRVIDLKALRGQRDSNDYFIRGWWRASQGQYRETAEDSATAIEIESHLPVRPYTEWARFNRAYALIRLDKPNEALEDLMAVRDNFSVRLDGALRSKRQLLREIAAARKSPPAPRRRRRKRADHE